MNRISAARPATCWWLTGRAPPRSILSGTLQRTAESVVGRVPFLLVLNKADLDAQWEIDDKALWKLVEHGWSVVRTSAKTGAGVEDAFTKLAEEMLVS